MPMPKLAVLTVASIVALGTIAVFAEDLPAVDPAIATMTADQKVQARQAAMKEDGMLLKNAGGLTGQAAADNLTKVLQNFVNFSALFADGATNDKSHALPLIWQEWDKFEAILDKGRTTIVAMRKAATDGNQDEYMASLKTLGGVCGECHQSYRAKS